jgi:hypothetical protein
MAITRMKLQITIADIALTAIALFVVLAFFKGWG